MSACRPPLLVARALHRALHLQAHPAAGTSRTDPGPHDSHARAERSSSASSSSSALTRRSCFGLTGSDGRNDEFQPTEEFRLADWIELPGPFDFNSAVILPAARDDPHRRRDDLDRRADGRRARTACRPRSRRSTCSCATTSPAGTWTDEMAREVVPVRRDAVPLHLVLEPHRLHPAADQRPREDRHLRPRDPGFALYAATANISVPLALTLMVWVAYHVEGIRAQGSSATSRAGSRPARRAA